jgi:hypothetical protein
MARLPNPTGMKRAGESGIGAAFLYVSFFGRAKKETRRAGTKPRIK